MGVRIDEKQPVARGARGAGVLRQRNLVHRLEHHRRTCGERHFRRPVGGVVVADNQLRRPPSLSKRRRRGLDARERHTQARLLVVGGNDDGDLQGSGFEARDWRLGSRGVGFGAQGSGSGFGARTPLFINRMCSQCITWLADRIAGVRGVRPPRSVRFQADPACQAARSGQRLATGRTRRQPSG